MNYLDLFHGIGGFALGAHWAGMEFENHFCSDIEPYCQELYAKRFPDSIQLGDITKIDTASLPEGDWIISGGFPCQDISIAGKGAGIHGKRSGLWFEYWRIIGDLRPRFSIMENVGMLIHRGLREVLGSLAEIGYDAEWQDIRAADVGAPHRRERIWIVAYPDDAWKRRDERKGKIKKDTIPDSSSGRWNGNRQGTTIEKGLQPRSKYARELSGGLERLYIEIPDSDNKGLEGRDELSERPGEWIVGPRSKAEHYGWKSEPAVGRLANGVPRRMDRLKGLGNAIVPQIAELLFNRIKYILESEARTESLLEKASNVV